MRPRWIKAAIAALALTFAATGLAPQASANFDVYTTEGTHTINGRQWRTACENYSTTVERCRTEIWANTITHEGGKYVEKAGWAFNNLTYKPSPRTKWAEWNTLVTPGEHNVDGRKMEDRGDTD